MHFPSHRSSAAGRHRAACLLWLCPRPVAASLLSFCKCKRVGGDAWCWPSPWEANSSLDRFTAPKLWGACSLGPGHSPGFVLLFGNFPGCSQVKEMWEPLLVVAHSLHFKGHSDLFCSLLCVHRGKPSTPQSDAAAPQSTTWHRSRRWGQGSGLTATAASLLPHSGACALSCTHIHSSTFLSWPWAPAFRHSVSKTSQATQVVFVAPQLVFLTDPPSAC